MSIYDENLYMFGSVALAELRFISKAVITLWWDLHLQECARAESTRKKSPGFLLSS